MLIRCPSCGGGFELAEQALGVKATVPCTLCGRVVVVRDAQAVPPAPVDGTVPDDPATHAAIEPLQDEPTAVAGRGQGLALPADKRLSVAFLTGRRKGDLVLLDKPRTVFGRTGARADVEIDDPEMSRAHAALECHSSRVVLRDLRSRNGTFVGEDRIESRDLEDRSEFRLGSTCLMLIVADRT
jgi:hypothetical protein